MTPTLIKHFIEITPGQIMTPDANPGNKHCAVGVKCITLV